MLRRKKTGSHLNQPSMPIRAIGKYVPSMHWVPTPPTGWASPRGTTAHRERKPARDVGASAVVVTSIGDENATFVLNITRHTRKNLSKTPW